MGLYDLIGLLSYLFGPGGYSFAVSLSETIRYIVIHYHATYITKDVGDFNRCENVLPWYRTIGQKMKNTRVFIYKVDTQMVLSKFIHHNLRLAPSSYQPINWFSGAAGHSTSVLTQWGQDNMAANSQTTLSNAFSIMKINEFRLAFHWSLFLSFESTMFQHWFR